MSGKLTKAAPLQTTWTWRGSVESVLQQQPSPIRGLFPILAANSQHLLQSNVNLIYTPGHVDFTIEVDRSLRVVDGAVTLLDASAGVQSQTVTVWRQAERYCIPNIAFLNKMDNFGANVVDSLASLRTRLGSSPLLVHLPVGIENQFRCVFDLVDGTLHLWDAYSSDAEKNPLHYRSGRPAQRHRFEEAPSLLATLCARERISTRSGPARELLLSPDVVRRERSVCSPSSSNWTSSSPSSFSARSSTRVPSTRRSCASRSRCNDAIRRVTLAGRALPVLIGSSKRNMGVHLLMDAVLRCLPSPLEREYPFLECACE